MQTKRKEPQRAPKYALAWRTGDGEELPRPQFGTFTNYLDAKAQERTRNRYNFGNRLCLGRYVVVEL